MRKIDCGCGATMREHTDEALVAAAERHIAAEHADVLAVTRREDLLALAEDDVPAMGSATAQRAA